MLHEIFGVCRVWRAVFGQRVRHVPGELEGVTIEDARVRDPEIRQGRQALALGRAGGDHGEFRVPLKGRRGKLEGIGISPPNEPASSGQKTDLRKDLPWSGAAEYHLLLTHPHPARIHHKAPPVIEKSLLVLALEPLTGGAKKSEGARVGEDRCEQREVAAARVFEDLVDRSPLVCRQHRVPERLGLGKPGVVVLVRFQHAETLGRDLAAIDKGIGEAPLHEILGEGRVRADQDDPGAQGLAELGAGKARALAAAHHQERITRSDLETLDHGAVGGAVGQHQRGQPFRAAAFERCRHGYRPFLVDHGELRVEAVVGLITTNIESGPGVEDHRLPDLHTGDCRTRVDHYADGVAAWDVDGGVVAATKDRDRKPEGCKVGVEVRPGGEDRHQDATGIRLLQSGRGHLLEANGFLRGSVLIAMQGQGGHRGGNWACEIWGEPQIPSVAGYRGSSRRVGWIGHFSTLLPEINPGFGGRNEAVARDSMGCFRTGRIPNYLWVRGRVGLGPPLASKQVFQARDSTTHCRQQDRRQLEW